MQIRPFSHAGLLLRRIPEAEGRPRGSGGLGPQSIEDIRHEKRPASPVYFRASGGNTNFSAEITDNQ